MKGGGHSWPQPPEVKYSDMILPVIDMHRDCPPLVLVCQVFGPDHYRTANMHLRLGDALAHMQPAQPHERMAAYERALAVCDPASSPLQGDAHPYNQVNQALATYPRVLLCYAEMEQTPVVLGRVHEITERIAVLQVRSGRGGK